MEFRTHPSGRVYPLRKRRVVGCSSEDEIGYLIRNGEIEIEDPDEFIGGKRDTADPATIMKVKALSDGRISEDGLEKMQAQTDGDHEWIFHETSTGTEPVQHGGLHSVEYDYPLGESLADVHYHPSRYMDEEALRSDASQVVPSGRDLRMMWLNAAANQTRDDDWRKYTEGIIAPMGVGIYTLSIPQDRAEREYFRRKILKLADQSDSGDMDYEEKNHVINELLERGHMKARVVPFEDGNSRNILQLMEVN